ncbi:sensor histidine kinase [Microbacterium hatanonis]|uniref:histidine kinase n=1 Tax=Microbacterium hatanonis TaxID=404366 RepID=A0A5C8HW98_9MICO|nr:histidine kinase [Microbacterium hatanonis]TXK09562.1 two-component sensor histidine kinase [Microbacterium hatanonis]
MSLQAGTRSSSSLRSPTSLGGILAEPETLDRRILGRPRAALLFALTVFVATAVQVLSVPISALVSAQGQWSLPIPLPAMFTLLIVGCAAQCALLLICDRHPVMAVAGTTAIYLALALGLSVPSWLVPMRAVIAIALFLLATRAAPVRTLLTLAAVIVVSVVGFLLWALALGGDVGVAVGFVVAEAVGIVAITGGATVLGLWWGAQTRRLLLERHRADTARREHEKRVEEARGRERARIAQELHDVAGQHLAGLIALTDAAMSLAPEHPERALELVEDVRNEGRFAAASLAGALADFRAVGATPIEATRDLRRADELVTYWQKRGMPLQFASSGPMDELPAVVSTTAYRALQEALTNAAKHAPGAAVDVDLAHSPGMLELHVKNDPPRPGTEPLPGLNLGWGLTGMREHIDLLRGTMTSGDTADGGWGVRVRIPVAHID